MSAEFSPPDIPYLGEDDADFFQNIHGRTLNTLNPRYMLPVDRDEVKVFPSLFSPCPFIFTKFLQAFRAPSQAAPVRFWR